MMQTRRRPALKARTSFGSHRAIAAEAFPNRDCAGAAGFSLIELLVVLIIVGILAGLGIAGFEKMVKKYNIDNQARRIQADLSNVRIMAMSKGRTHFVAFSTTGYTAYDDTNENATLESASDPAVLAGNQALNLSTVTNQAFFPLTFDGGSEIDFSSRGLCTTAVPIQTICIDKDDTEVNPRYDCVSVSTTRIALGKLAAKGVCSAANCQVQ